MEEPRRRYAWPLPVAVLALIVMLAASIAFVFRRASALPGEMVQQTREALRSIAEAFRTGTVTTSFTSYATQVSGSARFQFATLDQMEVFERKDTATVLWGALDLPDVVVEARAPVSCSYYLDLDKPWKLRLEGNIVVVTAPPIEFNTPAIDASAIRFEVRKGSLLRDETMAQEALKAGLTAMSKAKARENIALVREVGRHRTEQFVEHWIVANWNDGGGYHARVVFADEADVAPASPLGPLR